MEQTQLKEKYGWSKSSEETSIHFVDKENEYRGSFRIKSHKGKFFWYYRLSQRVPKRDIYLCSVEPKDIKSNQTSFQYSCDVLKEKIEHKFQITSRNKTLLSTYIIKYLDKLEEEKKSRGGRNIRTINGMRAGVLDFKDFCDQRKVKASIVPTDKMEELFIDYITNLSTRETKNKIMGKLSRGTIKVYSQDVRYFLDYLCGKGKYIRGGEKLFPNHPITVEIQNYYINGIVGKYKPKILQPFRQEDYNKIYQDCIKEVRDIWKEYCKNEGQLPRIGYDTHYGTSKPNQPSHTIGKEIVYFLSLFQLRGGFRIGEVFYSYRNRKIFEDYHNKYRSKEMGSFFEKTNDEWSLYIFNSKGKNRTVPIDTTVASYHKPINRVSAKEKKHGKDKNRISWETNIVDVVMELFPNSLYTFPSPNYHEKENEPRSITWYMNMFKEISYQKKWDKLGVRRTHNLRSFFISNMISAEGVSPSALSAITGHTISTMENYYLREDPKWKLETLGKIPQTSLHKKKLIHIRDKEVKQ
jgi:hypothetical protein